MRVTEIWRFPVKSMQGERLPETMVGPLGIEGDRGWALFDEDTGAHLTARRVPELLQAAAQLIEDGDEPARVRIILPDGTETDDDHTLSAWLGRPVRLQRAQPGLQGRFQTQRDETETGEWFTWEGPDGSFHDSTRASISLVSEPSFGAWDRRRFRINVVVDDAGDVDLVGTRISVGEAEIDIVKRIDRCVMTTRPQPAHIDRFGPLPAVERDLDVLRTINRDLESSLGVGGRAVGRARLVVGDHVTMVR